jgi:hypothetical protein
MDTEKKKDNQLDLLIRLATPGTESDVEEFFLSAAGVGYVSIRHDGHFENYALESGDFAGWLSRQYYLATKKGANASAIKDAIATLNASARVNGKRRRVRLRVGQKEGRHYLDLGDDKWRAICLTGDGFEVVERPDGIRFRRDETMMQLPEPKRPTREHPGKLSALLNIEEKDAPLIQAFVLRAMGDYGQKSGGYPILILTGEQGTAKTTAARLIASLVDPRAGQIQLRPRSQKDLMVAAHGSHVLVFDNLSGFPAETSDNLCGLATGTGFRVRKLYSDLQEVTVDACRPMILTGIGDVATRPDLLDRSMVVQMQPITEDKRRTDEEIEDAFAAERPYILWNLLTAYQRGLVRFETTRPKNLPRMASFARWAAACLGDSFLDAYSTNQREEANDAALSASPIYGPLVALLADAPYYIYDEPAELLSKLTKQMMGEKLPRDWPNNPSGLSKTISRIAPNLRRAGFSVETPKRNGRRYVEIRPETDVADAA